MTSKTSQVENSDLLTRIRKILSLKITNEMYAVFLIIILGLLLLPWRIWPVELAANFLHLGLLPSIPLLIFYAIKRKWINVGLWTIPSIAFIFIYGGLFLPAFGSGHLCDTGNPDSCRHLTVMTANIQGNSRLDFIKESGADIVTLQEINRSCADAIEVELIDLYPYQVVESGGIAGTALLSKYPITSHEILLFDIGILKQLKAEIDVDGVPVTVISAHPMPPILEGGRYNVRGTQEIKELVNLANEADHALLMGDFNITDQAKDYNIMINAGLVDSFREAGWGFGVTWPSRLPGIKIFPRMIRIDYIWHSEDFIAERAWTGPIIDSDHVPVIAELVLEL